MNEPDYYKSNGLSPIGAFKQGLISKDEYRGFLIGNIIKYTIRAGKKDNAIKDLKKARHYIDFYMELLTKNHIENIPITLEVNNDIDYDKFKKDIEEALREANNENIIIQEIPTEDINITKIELTDAMYDEDGNLKPEVREKIKEYLIQRRQSRQ